MTKLSSVLASFVLAVGLVCLGLAVKAGLESFTDRQRVVEVRGLAEREVPANVVTWPVVFVLYGNDLPSVYANVTETNSKVVGFLKQNGITDDEMSISAPQLNDRSANPYGSKDYVNRYYITSVVTVSSSKIDLVRGLINRQGELLAQGVPVAASDYSNQVSYEYTGLNDIKPAMIADATANARLAAQQFADDSHSRLGKIKTATQGQFSITDRDSYTPYIKRVRVVTNLTYYIED